VLTESIPSRPGFGTDPQPISRRLQASTQELLKDLLADERTAVTLFHDDTPGAREFIGALTEDLISERLTTQAADKPPAELQQQLGACGAVLSFSLHGLLLAANGGAPVAGVADEPGAKAFLASLGLQQHALLLHDGALEPREAAAALRTLAAAGAELRADLQRKLAVLRRKEAQTARMLELVVPRRVVRARHEEGADAFEDEDDEAGDEEDRPRRPARRAVKRRGK
jgi:polysaccharide pyruvyl transferase WcaK-like protein